MKHKLKIILLLLSSLMVINAFTYRCEAKNLYNLILNDLKTEGDVDETQMPYKIKTHFYPSDTITILTDTFEDKKTIQSIVNILKSCDYTVLNEEYKEDINYPMNQLLLYLYYPEIIYNGEVTDSSYRTNKSITINLRENDCFVLLMTGKNTSKRFVSLSNYDAIESLNNYFSTQYERTLIYRPSNDETSSLEIQNDINTINLQDETKSINDLDINNAKQVSNTTNKINNVEINNVVNTVIDKEIKNDAKDNYSNNKFINGILKNKNNLCIAIIEVILILSLIIIIIKHNKK